MTVAARISISEAFDGGNIEFVETKKDYSTVLLRIKSDPYAELEKTSHSQHFLLPIDCEHCTRATYCQVCTRKCIRDILCQSLTWFVVYCLFQQDTEPNSWTRKLDTTTYENGQLSWTHDHQSSESVYLCTYFTLCPICVPTARYRDHLRTNMHVVHQSQYREWAPTKGKDGNYYEEAPTMERSPEVYMVLKAMDKTCVGCLFGCSWRRKELPFNFLAGAMGCPKLGSTPSNICRGGLFGILYTRQCGYAAACGLTLPEEDAYVEPSDKY